jgi:hypothetical protein
VPNVLLSTPKAGIVFVPFEDAKFLLFRGDALLFVLVLMMFAFYVLHQLGQYRTRSLAAAFMRVYSHLYGSEVANAREIPATSAKEISGTKLMAIASATYWATTRRYFTAKGSDHRTYKFIDGVLMAANEAEAQKKAPTISTPA